MIRFITIVCLLLFSLLAVFRAPAYPLWLVSVIVQGFPWIFVLAVLVLLLTGGYRGKFGLVNAIASALAIVLFLSPVIRAYSAGRGLGGRLVASFGVIELHGDSTDTDRINKGKAEVAAAAREVPFHWWGMFTGIRPPAVEPRTLVYGSPQDGNLSLDLYTARQPGPRPCVLVIHGGAWNSGDSKELPQLNSRLALDGYTVAAVNYRLAPRYHNPSAVEDVRTALRYLKSHAAGLYIDTTSFFLLGRSAGAQIALLAAYTLQDTCIKGVIDFYGPTDLAWGYSHPASPLVMDSKKVLSDYLGGPYATVPQQYAAGSPVNFADSARIPTLIIHGQQDPLVAYGHSTRLNRKLADSAVRHYLLTLPWATHGFDFPLNGPGGQLSTYAVEKFLGIICQKKQ